MLRHHWFWRKIVALLGTGFLLALGMMATDDPLNPTLHPQLVKEFLVCWWLVVWFGALPALLFSGLSDLLTSAAWIREPKKTTSDPANPSPSTGKLRFWSALAVHLSGTFLLMLLVNGYETPWGPENGEKLGFCMVAVLLFFLFDEGLKSKVPRTQEGK